MLLPNRLKPGDKVCIIAPSGSMMPVSARIINNITHLFESMGMQVVFGKNTDKDWYGNGGTAEERATDLMDAFTDPTIKAIIPIFGGYTSNQILGKLNYGVIKNNPKFFMGYSDITALCLAINAKTGLTTYSGPGGTQLGHYWPSDYTIDSFKKIATEGGKVEYIAAKKWTEGVWWLNQNEDGRSWDRNTSFNVVNQGIATGKSFGGNLSTISLLGGTEYLKIPENPILFLEECAEFSEGIIIRTLIHLKELGLFDNAKGIVFGRFQQQSKVRENYLIDILRELLSDFNIPIILGADFGHTEPLFTFPIGADCYIDTSKGVITFNNYIN